MINRRKLITGLISFVAAPAIVRVESLMKLPKPIKTLSEEEIKKILDKITVNSQYGKFAASYNYFENGELKITSIPYEDLYISRKDFYK